MKKVFHFKIMYLLNYLSKCLFNQLGHGDIRSMSFRNQWFQKKYFKTCSVLKLRIQIFRNQNISSLSIFRTLFWNGRRLSACAHWGCGPIKGVGPPLRSPLGTYLSLGTRVQIQRFQEAKSWYEKNTKKIKIVEFE